ncbi:MAG TPA: hypothetical protein VN740_07370 [Solirubrobacteraceae bacterium]|nr:hypothetical protein [Solirubrobacteraceae bacterium]
MARRLLPALALALLVLAPAARATVSQTPDVTDTRYSSVLVGEHPVIAGVIWHVIDRNDEIELVNHSHETVTIFGYSQEQRNVAYDGGRYARILGDGTVQINENSPAYYLNQSFFETGVTVPPSATATAPPNWVTVAHNATYIWHDHRIHYLGLGTPKIVTDVHRRTLVFPWYVPVQVGATPGYLYGKLYWNAEKSFSFPIGAIIALIVVVIGGAALVIVVRRRRADGPPREVW